MVFVTAPGRFLGAVIVTVNSVLLLAATLIDFMLRITRGSALSFS